MVANHGAYASRSEDGRCRNCSPNPRNHLLQRCLARDPATHKQTPIIQVHHILQVVANRGVLLEQHPNASKPCDPLPQSFCRCHHLHQLVQALSWLLQWLLATTHESPFPTCGLVPFHGESTKGLPQWSGFGIESVHRDLPQLRPPPRGCASNRLVQR